MGKYRFSVTYSSVIDTGDIPPSVVQRMLEEHDESIDFSLFDGEVDVEEVTYVKEGK